MTLELNTIQRNAIVESMLSRVKVVNELINLFQNYEDKYLFVHYTNESIILQELLDKLNQF